MKIGVVSDTHGLLRPDVLPALAGVEHILHAGDVGDVAILDVLRTIAPVTAIRGNVDVHGAAAELPATEAIELNGQLVYMLHDLGELDVKPSAAGIAVVVYGHSHRPAVEYREGVLFLNPGSCGPRRFSLPVSLALLELDGKMARAEIVVLKV